MKTATLIKESISQSGVKQKHYKLSEPVKYESLHEPNGKTSYIIISQVVSRWAQETFAFPANENGETINMLELPGSSRIPVPHEKVLENMGYTLEKAIT